MTLDFQSLRIEEFIVFGIGKKKKLQFCALQLTKLLACYSENVPVNYLKDWISSVLPQVCYAKELKEGFVEYTEQVVKLMVPLLKFYFHDDILHETKMTCLQYVLQFHGQPMQISRFIQCF